MSSDRKFLIVFCILMVAALFPAAGTVCANQIPLGYVSYDPSTANLNTFSVNNFTGPFSLGIDFPVQTSLQIQNATLTLTDSSGIVDAISLGTIGPGTAFGGLFDPSLFSFTSAVFQGTLDLTTVSVLATDGVTLNTRQLFTSDWRLRVDVCKYCQSRYSRARLFLSSLKCFPFAFIAENCCMAEAKLSVMAKP
jgi:hypothetical protein